MWEQYFRIAEGQLAAGKYKTVEGYALKALECARTSGNLKQIAMSLALLSQFYIYTDNPSGVETRLQAVSSAELAYGPNSMELAEQLELLSCMLDYAPQFGSAEDARVRALAIRESLDEPESLLDVLDIFVQNYISQKKFDRAEVCFLRSLEIRQQLYGEHSEEVLAEGETHAEILEGLGRAEEAAPLAVTVDSAFTPGVPPSAVFV